jgi:hypothetical protein
LVICAVLLLLLCQSWQQVSAAGGGVSREAQPAEIWCLHCPHPRLVSCHLQQQLPLSD